MAKSKEITTARGSVITKPRSKYARHLRSEAHEVMRERIKGQLHLHHIFKDIESLRDLKATLTTDEISRLDKAIKHQITMLGKILPDIKSTEVNINGSIEHRDVKELSVKELEHYIRNLDAEDGEIIEQSTDDQET